MTPIQQMPPELALFFSHGDRTSQQLQQEAVLPLTLLPLHELRRTFMESIRHYNGAVAFASVCAEFDAFRGRGPPTYRVHGQVYHLLGPAALVPGQPSAFAQLYFIDTDEAI